VRYHLLFIFLFTSRLLWSQTADSISVDVQSKLDSLSRMNLADSLINIPNVSVVEDLKQQLTAKKDSITQIASVESLVLETQDKIDSLQNLSLPAEKYTKKLDSLTNKYPDIVKNKLTEWKDSGQKKIEGLKGKVEDKLSGSGADELTDQLPTDVIDTDNLTLPKNDIVGGGLGELDQPLGEMELPMDDLGLDEDIIPTIENPIQDEMDGVSKEIDEIKNVPAKELEGVEEIEQLKEGTKEVKEYLGEAGEVQGEIQQAADGDLTGLEERGEEELVKRTNISEELGQAEEFEKLKAQFDDQKAIAEKYQDPEFVKQRILEKSKNVANDLLAKYTEQIAAAKAKAALSDLSGINADTIFKAHEKAHPYRLKNRSFRDRSYLGINWEITKSESLSRLDLAPLFGYKYNMKLSLWGSYMYRIRLGNGGQSINQYQAVYGPRLALSYDVWKGFYIRSTAELLRVNVKVENVPDRREWKEGIYVGIGKDYKISKHLNGDMHLMYNFRHSKLSSPFPKKINIRFGFYFDLMKRSAKMPWKKEYKKIKSGK
jgi:hypothetical protein